MKINRISPDKHKFLQITTTIAKVPEKLHFIGTLPETRIPSVAIVGTRKPTAYGKEVGHTLAFDLAKRGVAVISGLALGIDAIAHRGALEAGGTTIAVLGNGLPDIYPATHKDLARQITERGGAIISEYEPGVSARQYQFLERNRLVSALSDAIIIVEAAARSGTLNIAGHALEQGREVFVVPGNITSPLSAGCNNLLKQGAHPVTCASDVLEVIAPHLLKAQSILPLGNTPLESRLIELLQSGVRSGDQLQQESGAAPSEFNQTLTMMEITGTIRSLGSNQWALR
ncbi:MAG TPA: DNA-processing protein DprA [Candidatus Saccharimonadales bacterium]|nr:DNA-processing protein DprA [Candidatus Saccharimonadales bacterium]